MTFTYLGTLATDLDKVRFHTGDTDSAGYFLPDETITALLVSEGSVGKAVIACLEFKHSKLCQPNFKADWLQVDNDTARKGVEDLIRRKRAYFGLAQYTATVTHVYRADSDQDEEPDYDA